MRDSEPDPYASRFGEEGGINLAGFVENNAAQRIDVLGLKWMEAVYEGNEFWRGYQIAQPGNSEVGKILGAFRGGSGIGKNLQYQEPILEEGGGGGCYCVKDNTGIWDVQWHWWGVKPGKPKAGGPQNPPGTVLLFGNIEITPAIAADFTWHERTEIGLLKKLFTKTVAIAEERAKEYWCSTAKRAKSKKELEDYIRWDRARKSYEAEAKSGSHFDLRFGSTLETGVPKLITPSAQYKEAEFDQWYAPNIWK